MNKLKIVLSVTFIVIRASMVIAAFYIGFHIEQLYLQSNYYNNIQNSLISSLTTVQIFMGGSEGRIGVFLAGFVPTYWVLACFYNIIVKISRHYLDDIF